MLTSRSPHLQKRGQTPLAASTLPGDWPPLCPPLPGYCSCKRACVHILGPGRVHSPRSAEQGLSQRPGLGWAGDRVIVPSAIWVGSLSSLPPHQTPGGTNTRSMAIRRALRTGGEVLPGAAGGAPDRIPTVSQGLDSVVAFSRGEGVRPRVSGTLTLAGPRTRSGRGWRRRGRRGRHWRAPG